MTAVADDRASAILAINLSFCIGRQAGGKPPFSLRWLSMSAYLFDELELSTHTRVTELERLTFDAFSTGIS